MMRRSLFVAAAVLSTLVSACKDPETAKKEYLKSGDDYAAAGKLHEAAIEYQNALKQDARFGDARYKLAETLAKNGDSAGAYREYIRAADLLPQKAEAQVKAGAMNLAAGQFEDARVRADKAVRLNPKSVEAHLLRANALAGLNQTGSAITALEQAIALDPTRSLSYSNLGAMQVSIGKLSDAETSFIKAVEVDPKAMRPRTELSNFLWQTNRRERAEAAIREALAIAPQDVVANQQLASMLLASNRPDEAEAPLRVIAASSKDVQARVLLADYYRNRGRIPEALSELAKLESDPKGFVASRTRKASILSAQGSKAEAYQAIEAALAKAPTNVEALLTKADLLMADSKPQEALKVAERATAAEATSSIAHFAVGRLRRAVGDIDGAMTAFNEALRLDSKSVATRLELARTELAAQRPKEAAQLAQGVLATQPNNADALLLEARGFMLSGDVRSAERPMLALVRAYPSTPVVQVQLGELYALKGDENAARAAYGKALSLEPKNVDALTGLVDLDLKEGRGAEARSRVESALQRQPDTVRVLMLAGRVQAQAGDFPAAEQSFRRVVELDSTNPDVYGLLGQIYRIQGRTEDAIQEFDRLAARLPKPAGVHTAVGMLLQSQNRIDEAKKRYELALSIDSEAALAANNLAWLIAEHGGNLDVALQLAQTAKSKLPDSPSVGDTLGWVYYKKGLFPQAVSALKESVARDPQVASVQYHLGFSSNRAGDSQLAKSSLRTALKLDAKATEAEEARRILARLEAGS